MAYRGPSTSAPTLGLTTVSDEDIVETGYIHYGCIQSERNPDAQPAFPSRPEPQGYRRPPGARAAPAATAPIAASERSAVPRLGAEALMAQREADVRALLPLSPSAFHILLVLAQGERHG